MDPLAQVVLLIVAASCAVSLVPRLRAPRRAAGPIVLLGAILVAALAAAYRRPIPSWLLLAICTAFGAFVVVPGLLLGGIRSALRTGRWRLALALARVRRVLQVDAGGGDEIEILRGLALVGEGRAEEAIDAARQRLAAIPEGVFRLAAFEHLLTLCMHARRFEDAVAVVEAEGGVPLAAASPGIAAAMVRAYAEAGDLDRAGKSLALLEESPAALAPAFASAVNGARLAFVAHLGLAEELERILAAAPAFGAGIEPAHALLWRGLAAARAGDATAAAALWREAAASTRDPLVRRVAEQRLAVDRERVATPGAELRAIAAQATKRAAAYSAVPRVSGRFWRQAPATAVLLVLIAAVHALAEILGDLDDPWLLLRLGANFRAAVAQGEVWRLLSSVFLHGGVLHVALNAYALYLLGRLAEQIFGSPRLLIIFCVAGVAGSTASAAFGGAQHLSVGASGAVFGLIGACLVGLRALQGRVPEQWRKQLTYNLLIIVGLNLYIGFTVEVIDNAAHIGGFVGGLLVSWLLRPTAAVDGAGTRRALVVGAALVGAAILASGVLAAASGPQRLLARLPRKVVRSGSLEVRCPAYWSRIADRPGIALRDPLVGLLEPPTLEVLPPGPVAQDTSLGEHAATAGAARRAMWEASPQVRAATLSVQRRADGLMWNVIELDVEGTMMTDIGIHKRQGALILDAHVCMPRRHVARYRDVVEEIARTLRFVP